MLNVSLPPPSHVVPASVVVSRMPFDLQAQGHPLQRFASDGLRSGRGINYSLVPRVTCQSWMFPLAADNATGHMTKISPPLHGTWLPAGTLGTYF